MNVRPIPARVQLGRLIALLTSISAWGGAIAPALWAGHAYAQDSYESVIADVQPRIVKVYGAGGPGGLEDYQSGFLVSAEGHVLTARSYVLDTDQPLVVLNDGTRYAAEYLGHDPLIEIAVLKIDGIGLPHFNLEESVELQTGDRVLAFSNLYGVAVGNEPASVLHGNVSAVTELSARRGAFATPYRGRVYVLDAMTNNPGAAGGALTDQDGNLAGILGKELRNANNSIWLNFAVPINELVASVDDIRSGRFLPSSRSTDKEPVAEPLTLDLLGVVLVPNVVPNTPPYVDSVVADSAAAEAGLLPDDLILFVNDKLMASRRTVVEELAYVHRDDEVELTIQRGTEVLRITLTVRIP